MHYNALRTACAILGSQRERVPPHFVFVITNRISALPYMYTAQAQAQALSATRPHARAPGRGS